ncbi:hypothetical protein [Desulfoluna spongiiphila]|uniref:Uncharacterized conserved protein n=1 Tax=Desulfoluna spongiiphila TaxID=419481 RepID=A0A1G5D5L6_9BACT|nr:hypothetical protein [Desulfoluna spongiiphila]SCY10139.1 Uncharacterized conserved protein [Desulfoluna spongiiphila]
MSLKHCLLALVVLCAVTVNADATTSLSAIARWPYTPVASFLNPSPNAVDSGAHVNYTEPLVIWSVGDTVSILTSDTMAPVSAFRVETSTVIHDIHYDSTPGAETLYVAAGKSGLLIYDLSGLTGAPSAAASVPRGTLSQAPGNPGSRLISETQTQAVPEIDARGLGYYDGFIFLADMNFGMRVINVTDPDAPVEEPLTTQTADRISGYKQPDINGTYKTTGGYTNAAACRYDSRTYALVLDYYYGMRVFDVTDPKVIAAPVSKDMRSNLLYGSIALVTGLFAAEAPDGRFYAYVTAMDAYAEYSVASKLKVLVPGATLGDSPIVNTGRSLSPGDATGITVSNLTGFLADGDKGLQVIDFSATPVDGEVLDYPIIGSYDTHTRGSYSVDLVGDDAFMAAAENGLQKIDVATPSAPAHTQTVPSPVSGDAVWHEADHVYLLDGDSGLFIFNAAEPSSLLLKGFYENGGPAYDIAVSGNVACIADGTRGLTLVDVSTKSAPVLFSTTSTSDTATAVATFASGAKTYACVANGASQPYLVIDITTPATPGSPRAATTAGFTPGAAKDVATLGTHAYFADERGLKIVDIANPESPAVVAEKDTPGTAVAVAVFAQGGRIYALIADQSRGIIIEDVTNPLAIPGTVALIPPPDTGTYNHLDIENQIAFATAGEGGLTAFDISNPEAPKAVASYSTKSSAEQTSAFVKDGTLHGALAEKYNGLVITTLKETTPEEPAAPMESPSSSSSSCFINSADDNRLF